jgi:hypothetical protein
MQTERKDTANSTLNLWRFSLMSTVVTMTAAVAHLMELPAKMRYEPSLWVRLHRTMYPNFGRTAGPAEAAAVASTGLLPGGRGVSGPRRSDRPPSRRDASPPRTPSSGVSYSRSTPK